MPCHSLLNWSQDCQSKESFLCLKMELLPSKFTIYLDQLMKIDANSSYNIYVDTRDKIFQPIWSGNISIEQDFEEISQKQERFPVLGLIYARKANHVFQLYLRMEHWLQCKPTYFFPRQLLSCFHHV